MVDRRFEDHEAVRKSVPVLVGLFGPSGSGKTYTALRLAAGMQKVGGLETFVIDSEANRALHYADRFTFRHVPFQAPFGSLDYLAAIEHCVKRGAGQIIIDSQSHEHEGPGGVLEMHERELERLAGNDFAKRERVKMLAWAKPKAERRRLLNSILQINCNFVFCFRAKEKMKIEKGKDPLPLGFQPIAGEEFVYEMTLNLFLPPRADGVPDLKPGEVGERMMLKIPAQFREMLVAGKVLDEEFGEGLAKWAAGGAPAVTSKPPRESVVVREEILTVLRAHFTPEQKSDRAHALELAFGTPKWSAIEKLGEHDLTMGLEALRRNLEAPQRMREPGMDDGEEGADMEPQLPLGEGKKRG